MASRRARVALLIESSRASGRGLLRGVARYTHACTGWSLFCQERALSDALPRRLRRWRPDGIIARIESSKLARQIRRRWSWPVRWPRFPFRLPPCFGSRRGSPPAPHRRASGRRSRAALPTEVGPLPGPTAGLPASADRGSLCPAIGAALYAAGLPRGRTAKWKAATAPGAGASADESPPAPRPRPARSKLSRGEGTSSGPLHQEPSQSPQIRNSGRDAAVAAATGPPSTAEA